MLPGDPGFNEILSTSLPTGWEHVRAQNAGECFFVADSQTGLLRPANDRELDEYLYGGEYDERLATFEEQDVLINPDGSLEILDEF
jgi:hypothetical protein